MIAVDFSHINTQPVYDPVAQLVYAANSLQVSNVWVDGVEKLRDYQFTDIDAVETILAAQQWQQKIQSTDSTK